MRALRYHGNKDVRLDEIQAPTLRPGWVKIKNGWAGVCGSDLHEYLVGPKNAPTKPHILTGEQIPTVMGHEFSGRIVEVDADVPKNLITDQGLEVGRKCVVFPVLGDRECVWCQQGAHGCCPNWGFLGYSGYGGGFAEYICVDARDVITIPDSMRLDVAALVEPLAVAWHAVNLGEAKAEDSVLVLGAGPIGIAVILCLRAQGVGNISVSEISPLRSEQARNAGATFVFNPKSDDVVKKVQEVSPDGWGPQVVFECAGVQASMDVALAAVRGKGTIVNIGIFEGDIKINPNVINRRSLRYLGSNIYTREEFQQVVDAIADGKILNRTCLCRLWIWYRLTVYCVGRIKEPERMISARISLEEGVEKGFNALIHEREKHCKILIGVDDDP
jgi:threonine dehydrogenase-like Zn-dependent dehydrogenase